MNLREYAIVGGVYKLTRFAKLPQPVEPRSGFLFTTGRVGLKLTERGYRGRRQLYTILREHARRQRALDREQLVRDELVAAYDRFLAVHRYGDLASSSTPAIAEMRHPTEADIEIEKAGGKRRSRWTALGQGISSIVSAEEPKEMDEKLEQFPLVHPSRPRYLHPATLRSRQRPVMIATDQPGHPGHTIDADAERCMGELVRTLQAANTMDDEEAEERLCAHFSTFLRLLDYLREQEKPIFPVKPPPKVALEPVRASATGKQQQQVKRQTVPRVFKHRNMVVVQMPGRRPSRRTIASAAAVRRASSMPRLSTVSTKGRLSMRKKQRKRSKSQSGPSTVVVNDAVVEEEEKEAEKKEEVEPKWALDGASRRPNVRKAKADGKEAIVALKTATGLELAFHVSTVGYRLKIVAESVERSTPNAPLHSDPRLDTELTLDELEKLLVKLNLHLFPQPDTCFYANGSSSSSSRSSATLKHDAMEMHNLQCLAVFCLTHQLEWCLWNRARGTGTADQHQYHPTTTTIKITPLGVLTVEVEELCSPTLEQILLAYHPVPVDQSYNADCYGLLKGALEEPSRKVLSKTPPMLQWHVGQLLQKLRLLSYS
ncbi:hypothetical protein AND_009253 [Anopheles darlingi]|uniref:CASC1 C-terminal domain-containing protein n=1 Tax=Anopheles darlingi TaxID=43151 RepID=W5J8F4_ANODA|nr:hypothetical protein AND_009253 [Anopheles darlingi]